LTFVACIRGEAAVGKQTLEILPRKTALRGADARQRLLVELARDGHYLGQAPSDGLILESSNPKIVRVDKDGVLTPVSDGVATIRATRRGQTAKTEVTVTGMDRAMGWNFRNDVQPVLAKSGCNAGACHGAAAGQNGFKLSLRGYDNEGDYTALTHQAFGRRILPSDPARSLVLLKPTAAVPHKGGKRFETNSIDYRILSEWIAEGAPGPKDDDPRIVNIEVLPETVVLRPGDSQQLLVRATFSDGHVADVTHWAKFNAANASVTQVDDEGKVNVIGNGEGAITVWYLSRIAVATVTAPFSNSINPRVFAGAPRRNFIDDLTLEKLQSLNLPPSPRCSDAEFIRRVFIDAAGILPAESETVAFVADKSPGKRDRLIDSVLQRTEFIDYWAYKWSDLLLVNSAKLKPAAVWAYYDWIRGNVAANTPWDEMAREVVTARGSTLRNGAANFYVLHDDPRAMTETTSQAFLGMSVTCAKCHNHPLEKWTNDQYYKMANLFARVRVKDGSRAGESVVFTSTDGDLVQPLRGKPQIPAPLDGKPVPISWRGDRREPLADWLVSPENPYFSRAIVNRIWANYMGVGLVENVDDLRATNPASNEKLLAASAQYLAGHHFDLKAFMRVILQSETYQRSSKPLPENQGDTRFYARYYPRRMMAEVLLDAISQVTGVPTEFKRDGGGVYPVSWRALQLPDVSADSYFLKSFGRPERNITCECERTADPSMTQVLDISNGDTINKKLEAKTGRISKMLEGKMPSAKMIEEAYLAAFSRLPTAEESASLEKVFDKAGEKDRRTVVEDMFWALLSSKEFLFNH
jgi:hypothetical protein